ncbi:MAG: anti-sigma factor antagonist [Verrucomicrobia bacterium]|nr:anti-sigma factor antagonist [Verrucomicrobiota bacterium]NBU11370.1 anti-sigma factor antagonist [Pseudomonadota bacterium]NDB76806.1 anti-sigma factor antagonist [Verrucomicrobiota bacterium]NDE99452.1 anti-sigma factor antagonist [Verrucomicrobiota bacterium]
MTSPSPNLLAARVGDAVCVKISGRANFAVSVDFKRLVHESRARGAQRFLVDLSACVLMDSTFLGVLAGLGTQLSAEDLPPEQRPIELLNPTPKVADLIDNLGVLHLFRVVQGGSAENLCYTAVESAGASKLEMSRNCLEAHEVLMDLNPENVAKFKDVAKFFAEDIAKQEAPPAAPGS